MVSIADGKILAALEEEIATAGAQHHSGGNPRSPDDGSVDDALEVSEQRCATAIAATLDVNPRILAEGDAIRAVDARFAQLGDGGRSAQREIAGVITEHNRIMGAGLEDSGDAGFLPAIDDGGVFNAGEIQRRLVEGVIVDVLRTTGSGF